jgi:hypothetical protein
MLNSSLAELVKVLYKGGRDKFPHTSAHLLDPRLIKDSTIDQNVMFKKGTYPYSNMMGAINFSRRACPIAVVSTTI